MNTRTTAIALIPVTASAALALAACGPHTGQHAAAGQSAKAHVSALATSSTGQLAKTDAQKLLQADPPPQGAAQLSLAAWEAWAKYAGVPEKNWKLAGGCIVTRVEHGGKLPKDKQARNTALINEAFPCVQQYHGGVK